MGLAELPWSRHSFGSGLSWLGTSTLIMVILGFYLCGPLLFTARGVLLAMFSHPNSLTNSLFKCKYDSIKN